MEGRGGGGGWGVGGEGQNAFKILNQHWAHVLREGDVVPLAYDDGASRFVSDLSETPKTRLFLLLCSVERVYNEICPCPD